MRILCSGATGFIGSHLVPLLEADGHQVVSLWRYTAARVPRPEQDVVWGDLNLDDMHRVVGLVLPDIIIHLGALASNAQANAHPVEAMQTNAVGTARLVEAAKAYNVKAFILASSSEVYGRPNERYALNPYAASKIAAEESVIASGLPFVISRAFNTYGRGPINLPRFVVDEAIHQALTTGEIRLRDYSPKRDFLFRDDHVGAYG